MVIGRLMPEEPVGGPGPDAVILPEERAGKPRLGAGIGRPTPVITVWVPAGGGPMGGAVVGRGPGWGHSIEVAVNGGKWEHALVSYVSWGKRLSMGEWMTGTFPFPSNCRESCM